ncbi:MAG: hypothetical protein V3U84_02340 [Thiotrichaceae bacterium]
MYRWFLCPVETHTVLDDQAQPTGKTYRKPRVSTFIEPGRGKPYMHTSAIDVGNWCLSLVAAEDFSALVADSQCIDLFNTDFGNPDALLRTSPFAIEMSAQGVTDIKTRMQVRDVPVTDLDGNTNFEIWLNRIMTRIGNFKADGMRVHPEPIIVEEK